MGSIVKPLTNPEYENLKKQWDTLNVSPTCSIDVTVGYNEEGYPIFLSFQLGDIIEKDGLSCKVVGFTRRNTVLSIPHEGDHQSGVVGYELTPKEIYRGMQEGEAMKVNWNS